MLILNQLSHIVVAATCRTGDGEVELTTDGIGTLTILTAFISILDGLIALSTYLTLSNYISVFPVPNELKLPISPITFLVISFFALIGSVLGFAAGMQCIMRKESGYVKLGMPLLMVAGILNFLPLPASIPAWTIMFGIPMIILSSLVLVFVTTKKQ